MKTPSKRTIHRATATNTRPRLAGSSTPLLVTRDPDGPRLLRSRRVACAMAAVGGVLTTLSVPPFGFWPLAIVGIALLAWAIVNAGPRRRLLLGFIFGAALYVPSLWWMTAFSLPGGIFVGVLEAVITAVGLLVVSRRHTSVTLPVGLVAADVLRSLWPFGGLPLGGIDLGQANGPFAPVVTFGGRLGLVAITAVCGVVLAALVQAVGEIRFHLQPVGEQGRWRGARSAILALGSVVIVSAVATIAPDGTKQIGTKMVAGVQGGGPRGTRKSEQGTLRAYQRNIDATATLNDRVDLIVWPENVVDAPVFAGSSQLRDLGKITADHNAPLIAGLTEDGPTKNSFRNQSVLINVDGTIGMRFEKVRRVPYGEYFPFRTFIGRFATLPEREAVAGSKPGFLKTPIGPFAVTISYEGFFDDRARGGVRAGGQALLIPTNASSYVTTQVPTQQVAAAQLRALETKRWVVQVAPTGRSAIVNPKGQVIRRSVLSAAEVLVAKIGMRTGFTPYVRFNDLPILLLGCLVLAACWIADLRKYRRRP